MEIYDDPNRIIVVRPSAGVPYDRHYKKHAPGKELFLLGSVLYLLLGSIGLITLLTDCLRLPMHTVLLYVVGSMALFIAGGLGIKYRCYPNKGMLCVAAALLACAACLPWLFAQALKAAGWICVSNSLLFMCAHVLNHR